jgi:ParB-like chromosome segregation protein Spo0J
MSSKFTIEFRSIDSIRPYEKNPRVNDDAVDAVAASLKEFGFRSPIVVDGDGVIICGHTRLKAAQKLGLAKVPVHVAKDLTPDQVKALRIADNKTSDLSDWDYDILPIELAELQDAGFDLGILAFDEDELSKLLSAEPTEGLTDDDAVPEPPKEAITQPGDLWLLGAYTVCPHCKERNDVED